MIKKIIKRSLLLILVVLAVLIFWQISKNNPKTVLKNLIAKNQLSKSPQKFNLLVKFLGVIPAGKAVIHKQSIKTYEGRKVYYLSARAQPLSFVDKFYKVRAAAESYIDRETLLPFLFKHHLYLQDELEEEKEARYDQENNIMETEGSSRVILANTYDPLSAIFFIRNTDLDKLKEFDININTNQKNYTMKGRVISKDTIVINGNEFNIFVLKAHISRKQKSRYHQSDLTFYLLDDQDKTPLLIKVMSGGVYIVAHLTGTEEK